ncbi:hypothetical protein HPB48_019753 [Haemaphysalis longicornis]|uniref:Uncharacterized protein n=1 Tax=Haemaphysalis longicornis TaxID=44386 RepID=A0A9J6FNF9_HAELO|nr:hypothetical protein HPB48_019753 [Haemaphysalis longicornis]
MHFLELVLVCAFLTVPASEPVLAEGIKFAVRYFNASREACTPRPEALRIEDRATCRFTTSTDADSTRIPYELPVVKCNCPDSLCSCKGDYRCTELRSTIHVAYRDSSDGSMLRNGTVELATSCVCVAGRSDVAKRRPIRVGG